MSQPLKTFKVVIVITGLGGTSERVIKVECRTLKQARNRAYEIIGDQTGDIISIEQENVCE